MALASRYIPSSRNGRDLLGVAVYCLGIGLIAGVVYLGVKAAVPVVANATIPASVASVLDTSGSDPTDLKAKWKAEQEARRPVARDKAADKRTAEGAAAGPTGVAAAAKAKALAEIGGRAAPRSGSQAYGDTTLPKQAQPVEQSGYTLPQPRDRHQVY